MGGDGVRIVRLGPGEEAQVLVAADLYITVLSISRILEQQM